LGSWGVGELGSWGVGELGSWGVGELGSWPNYVSAFCPSFPALLPNLREGSRIKSPSPKFGREI
jgi:hypothetical protein